MRTIKTVDLDTRKMASMAGVSVPSGGSDGHLFLLEVKYCLFDFLRYPPTSGGSIEDAANELADLACDTDVHSQWSTFVDLEAWNETVDLKNLTLGEIAFAALHQITRRLCVRVLNETPRIVTLLSAPPGERAPGKPLKDIRDPWVEILKRPAVGNWLSDFDEETVFAVTDPSVKIPATLPALVVTVF